MIGVAESVGDAKNLMTAETTATTTWVMPLTVIIIAVMTVARIVTIGFNRNAMF